MAHVFVVAAVLVVVVGYERSSTASSRSTIEPTAVSMTPTSTLTAATVALTWPSPTTDPSSRPNSSGSVEHKSTEDLQQTAHTPASMGQAIDAAFASLGPRDGAVVADPLGSLRVIRNGDTAYDGASLLKLLLLARVYQDAVDGRIDWASRERVTPERVWTGTGILQLQVGATADLRRLTHLMIYHSDNTAANYLIERVGIERVNAFAKELGLKHTRLGRMFNEPGEPADDDQKKLTTPADMAALLGLLARKQVVNTAASTEMLHLLSMRAEIDPWWIPLAMPPGMRVWHITGRISGNRHDAALVELPDGREYVVVIMTVGEETPTAERAAEQRLSDTARAVGLALVGKQAEKGKGADLGR